MGAATINIKSTDQIHFVGDSLTVRTWYGLDGGLLDQMNAVQPGITIVPPPVESTHYTGRRAMIKAGSFPAKRRGATPTRSPAVTNFGAAGTDCTFFNGGQWPSRTPSTSDVVFFETGANDEMHHLDPVTYESCIRSCIDQTLAFSRPTPTRIVIVSCFLAGSEQWDAGSPPTLHVSNATLLPTLKGICASYPSRVLCADISTQVAAYEIANQPAFPGGSNFFLTGGDGVHPNTFGYRLMGQWIMPYLTFSA